MRTQNRHWYSPVVSKAAAILKSPIFFIFGIFVTLLIFYYVSVGDLPITRQDIPSTQHGTEKLAPIVDFAAIILLAPQSYIPKEMNDMRQVLSSLRSHFLNKYNYPVIIFHEDLTDSLKHEFRGILSAGAPQIAATPVSYHLVDFSTIPSNYDEDLVHDWLADPNLGLKSRLGYRMMCRFFSGAIFSHPAFKNLKWYMRMDSDSLLTMDVVRDPIREVAEVNAVYGYLEVKRDTPGAIAGLWESVISFLRPKPDVESIDGDDGDFSEEPDKDGVRKKMINPRLVLSSSGTYTRAMFYNNFEVVNIPFLNNTAGPRQLFEYLDKEGGFLKHRWGDAPVRALQMAIYAPAERLKQVTGVGYKHQKFEVTPSSENAK